MKLPILASAAIALFTMFSAQSHGAIVDSPDHSYLTDTSTNLDWLDVTTSAGESYAYVSSQFGVGGKYEGYQYATGTQFNQLVSNYTGNYNSPTNYNAVIQETDLIDGLVQMLGDTYVQFYVHNAGTPIPAFHQTVGFIAEGPSANLHYIAMLRDDDRSIGQQDFSYAHFWQFPAHAELDAFGSYLVRDTLVTTPIPAAAFMFAPALLGFLGFRRKAKNTLA